MSMTDPIADFLTRIRITAAHETVDIPSSSSGKGSKEQGYIDDSPIAPTADRPELIRVQLKYN